MKEPAATTTEWASGEGDVVVVAIGIDVPVCWQDQSSVRTLTAAVASESVTAYEALSAELERGSELVVVVPGLDATAARNGAGSARSLLPPGTMALHETRLAPLAAGTLVALAAQVARTLSGRGELAAAMPMLERELLSLACLPSVSRLRLPSPSVAQHAQSFLPSSRFTVLSHPQPAVLTVRDRLLPRNLPRPSADVSAVAASSFGRSGEMGAESLLDLVEGHFPLSRRHVVEPPAASRQWWGARAVELVLFPEDLAPVVERVRRRVAASSCDWCGAAMAGERCELCGHLRAAVSEGGR